LVTGILIAVMVLTRQRTELARRARYLVAESKAPLGVGGLELAIDGRRHAGHCYLLC
jgi:hypothetical protein